MDICDITNQNIFTLRNITTDKFIENKSGKPIKILLYTKEHKLI